ncbi:hypothetical protein ACFU8Q_36885 [Streptomyces sp. NPDC057543]|uniref:hypothetical protein n=1 Tax=Streptomyces sp. NPDC057543 TaxID=3346163 RepID=UPI003692AA41
MLRHELTLHYADVEPDGEAGAAASRQAAAWLEALDVEDVMISYSDWVGDWSEYHGNNRWQPLQGGHRAAGDCRAVLDCHRAMGKARGFAFSEGGS